MGPTGPVRVESAAGVCTAGELADALELAAQYGGAVSTPPPSCQEAAGGDAAPAGVAQRCACGGAMRRTATGLEYVCDACALVVEGDTAEPDEDDAAHDARDTLGGARLRIVGPGSGRLQANLYRSAAAASAAAQEGQTLEEYMAYRQLHIEAGGRAFPQDALKCAASLYCKVRAECVKRSHNKRTIMASCLYHACLDIGWAPQKSEIAAFMQLPSRGIARGDNFVRRMVADGKMVVEGIADAAADAERRLKAEVGTLFAHLGMEDARYDRLREAVREIVRASDAHHIGTNSVMRSKVAGATFDVLRRCAGAPDAALKELVRSPVSLHDFCTALIRKNTLDRFLRQLDSYHSHFVECYRAAGLDESPM